MYSIAICDDSAADREYVRSLAMQWAAQTDTAVSTHLFCSAEAFMFEYAENKSFDILLLDIEMPGMNGMELAHEVRRENPTVQLVFITGYADYIGEGYDVSALHYLMKPVGQEKLFSVLSNAAEKLRISSRSLLLRTADGTVRIPLSEIEYIEVRHNYITVHAADEHTVKKTLSQIESELDGRFFRTGRSHVVNLEHIRRITKTDVYFSGGSSIPLPRGMYDRLNRAIIDMM